MHKSFIIIFITSASVKDAEKIADCLLKKRLIACANIISGIRSRFRWRGRIEGSGEAMLLLKARSADFKRIEKEVRLIHTYDVPEIVAVPIVKGSMSYLNWLDANCRRKR